MADLGLKFESTSKVPCSSASSETGTDVETQSALPLAPVRPAELVTESQAFRVVTQAKIDQDSPYYFQNS